MKEELKFVQDLLASVRVQLLNVNVLQTLTVKIQKLIKYHVNLVGVTVMVMEKSPFKVPAHANFLARDVPLTNQHQREQPVAVTLKVPTTARP